MWKRLTAWLDVIDRRTGIKLAGVCLLLALLMRPFSPDFSRVLAFVALGAFALGPWFADHVTGPLCSLARRVEVLEEGVGNVREPLRDLELERRVAVLERVATPEALRRVYEFKPSLSDEFWSKRLGASPDEWAYVKKYGERLVSLTVEVWRTHTVIRSTIVPWPQKTWPDDTLPFLSQPPLRLPVAERVTHLYSTSFDEYFSYEVLWAVALGPDAPNPSITMLLDRGPRLELRLQDNDLQLCAIYGRFDRLGVPSRDEPKDENVFFNVPLDADELLAFKSEADEESHSDDDWSSLHYRTSPWLTRYRSQDLEGGISWEMWVHDLEKLGDDPDD